MAGSRETIMTGILIRGSGWHARAVVPADDGSAPVLANPLPNNSSAAAMVGRILPVPA
jgi:hypothetical protein